MVAVGEARDRASTTAAVNVSHCVPGDGHTNGSPPVSRAEKLRCEPGPPYQIGGGGETAPAHGRRDRARSASRAWRAGPGEGGRARKGAWRGENAIAAGGAGRARLLGVLPQRRRSRKRRQGEKGRMCGTGEGGGGGSKAEWRGGVGGW